MDFFNATLFSIIINVISVDACVWIDIPVFLMDKLMLTGQEILEFLLTTNEKHASQQESSLCYFLFHPESTPLAEMYL